MNKNNELQEFIEYAFNNGFRSSINYNNAIIDTITYDGSDYFYEFEFFDNDLNYDFKEVKRLFPSINLRQYKKYFKPIQKAVDNFKLIKKLQSQILVKEDTNKRSKI